MAGQVSQRQQGIVRGRHHVIVLPAVALCRAQVYQSLSPVPHAVPLQYLQQQWYCSSTHLGGEDGGGEAEDAGVVILQIAQQPALNSPRAWL